MTLVTRRRKRPLCGGSGITTPAIWDLARFAADAVSDVSVEGNRVDRRLGFSGYSVSGALWIVGFGGAADVEGDYGEQPFGTAEAVDIHAAMRSYTIWAARQLFLEKRVGSIGSGEGCGYGGVGSRSLWHQRRGS